MNIYLQNINVILPHKYETVTCHGSVRWREWFVGVGAILEMTIYMLILLKAGTLQSYILLSHCLSHTTATATQIYFFNLFSAKFQTHVGHKFHSCFKFAEHKIIKSFVWRKTLPECKTLEVIMCRPPTKINRWIQFQQSQSDSFTK